MVIRRKRVYIVSCDLSPIDTPIPEHSMFQFNYTVCINIFNSVGDMLQPWQRPFSTLISSDTNFPTLILDITFLYKFFMALITILLISMSSNAPHNFCKGTVSYAFFHIYKSGMDLSIIIALLNQLFNYKYMIFQLWSQLGSQFLFLYNFLPSNI